MWPLQKTAHGMTNQLATEKERVWTKQATGLSYDALFRRLFLHEYTEESRWLENSYKGPHWRWIQQQWKRCQDKPLRGLQVNGSALDISIDLIRSTPLVEQVWHTQQGVFRRKRPPDVRDDPMRGQ